MSETIADELVKAVNLYAYIQISCLGLEFHFSNLFLGRKDKILVLNWSCK